MRIRLLVLGSVVSGLALAAAPDTPMGEAFRFDGFTNLSGFDQRMEFLAAIPWELARTYEHMAPDDAGRTVDEDLAEYLLTRGAQEKLASLRSAAAATVAAPDEALAEGVLRPLAMAVGAEFCRLSALTLYWYAMAAGSELHHELDEQILRLPEEKRRDATATLDRISEGRKALRPSASYLTNDCNRHGSPSGEQQQQSYDRVTHLTEGYNEFRKDLSDSLSSLIAAGKIPADQFPRTTPCPAPPPDLSGGARVSVRRQGNISDYYPPRERDLGISGKVQVGMFYDATGCVTNVHVLRTSASRAIDRAAVMLSLDMELNPAVEDGKPVPGRVARVINFSLIGD